MHSLYLGTAKVNITPQKPIQLTGFLGRNKANYDSEASSIYARLFYFTQRNEEGAVQQVLIISADLLAWGDELVDEMRTEISGKWNIPQRDINLHATHSHTGPATRPFILIGDMDASYLTFLRKQILEGVGLAVDQLEQVMLERGIGESELGINRRQVANGEMVLGVNTMGPRDTDLNVIKFKAQDGSTKAMWVHYTCHPVHTSENQLSAEYCGYAVSKLEEHIGGDAVVGFLQGCCGDINPSIRGEWSGYSAIMESGNRIAAAVIQTLELRMNPIMIAELNSTRLTAELPYQRIPALVEWKNIRETGSQLESERAAYLLDNPQHLQNSAVLELTRIDFSEDLSLLLMNGEMVISYGLLTKHCSNGRTLPVAYSNGMVGYVTTKQQLEEGGYEPYDSVPYFALPAPFDIETEDIVNEHNEKLPAAELRGIYKIPHYSLRSL